MVGQPLGRLACLGKIDQCRILTELVCQYTRFSSLLFPRKSPRDLRDESPGRGPQNPFLKEKKKARQLGAADTPIDI